MDVIRILMFDIYIILRYRPLQHSRVSSLQLVCYRDLKVVSIITSNELTTPTEVTRESQLSGSGGGLYSVYAMLEI